MAGHELDILRQDAPVRLKQFPHTFRIITDLARDVARRKCDSARSKARLVYQIARPQKEVAIDKHHLLESEVEEMTKIWLFS